MTAYHSRQFLTTSYDVITRQVPDDVTSRLVAANTRVC